MDRADTVVEEIVSTPSGDWTIEAVVSEGRFDNYEEVEMEVDEEEEATPSMFESSADCVV